jgi:hypothetical protein
MRASILVPVALISLVIAGCRSGGNQELVERELRFQETEIYRLHEQLEDAESELDSLERENETLRRQADSGSPAAAGRSSSSSGGHGPPRIELPPFGGRSRAPADSMPPPELLNPTVEPGIESSPGPSSPPPSKRPREEAPSFNPQPRSFDSRGAAHHEPVDEPRVNDSRPNDARPNDSRLAGLELNSQLTGGRSRESGEGDVRVVFMPVNGAGQFVKAPGEVSIVVLDPALSGQAARIARWDYKANEMQTHLRSLGNTKGYYFDLYWPGRPPQHSSLEVFIRLKTTAGERFVANQSIQVVAPNDPTSPRHREPTGGPSLDDNTAGGGDDAGMQVAARDGQRSRLFSRIRGGNGSGDGTASGPAPPDPDGALNVTVPGADGGGASISNNAGGGSASGAKSKGLIDRSRLRGGPGLFDGSRIRGITGGNRDDKAPPAVGPGTDAPSYQGGGRGGEAPAYQGSGGGGGEAPRYLPGGGRDSGPAMPDVQLEEPAGAPPLDSSADSDAPASAKPPRTARPTWRPYR